VTSVRDINKVVDQRPDPFENRQYALDEQRHDSKVRHQR
jgi:hypothetical protein